MGRLCEERDALEQLFASANYKAWAERQDSATKLKHSECKALVHDDTFWKAADVLLRVALPITVLLRLVDGNKPCVGKVYHRCERC